MTIGYVSAVIAHFVPRICTIRKWKVFHEEFVEKILRDGHARVSLRFFGIEAATIR